MIKNSAQAWAIVILSVSVTGAANGQAANLRISEVDPHNDQVEVTNTGTAFTTSADRPFCHRFDYASDVLNGSFFDAGGSLVFDIVPTEDLNDTDSDLWLYLSAPFFTGANIIHGVKYGPEPGVGRTGLASTEGLWTGADQYAPAPPVGMTLAWDGFGFAPADWYIDETPTMGSADSTPDDAVATALSESGGTQDFEDISLGDEINTIVDWAFVNAAPGPGMFTVRVVNDLMGDTTPRSGASSKWLRIRDQDDANQNRFYTNAIDPEDETNYTWTFAVNLEQTPPSAGNTMPRITVQHPDPGFGNVWGVEFTETAVNLFVTGSGGVADSVQLYEISGATDIGQWVTIALGVDFDAATVTATFNGGGDVSLPIDPSGTMDTTRFRLCYRGEGAGNVMTMLLDDVSVELDGVVDCPGDTTGDLTVNLDDLLDVIGNWGSDGSGGGDTNGDNVVDLADLLAVIGNWGNSC